ncbi:MAG TPA: hypothetical protein VFJ64_10570 [Solirubrobacterales bacterium]|nr:hypothetical protein [Solirubrobacterales bacterium]
MSRTKRAGAVLAMLTGAVALFAIPAAASQPGQTVKVASTLQISAYGYFGKVKSPNSNCLAERTVVLKQQGHGVLGTDTSDDQGRWKVDPEDLHFKGKLPFKIYAVLKPITQATAGPIFKCSGATSKTITINGG